MRNTAESLWSDGCNVKQDTSYSIIIIIIIIIIICKHNHSGMHLWEEAANNNNNPPAVSTHIVMLGRTFNTVTLMRIHIKCRTSSKEWEYVSLWRNSSFMPALLDGLCGTFCFVSEWHCVRGMACSSLSHSNVLLRHAESIPPFLAAPNVNYFSRIVTFAHSYWNITENESQSQQLQGYRPTS